VVENTCSAIISGGGGGPEVRLQTARGSVTVRKASASEDVTFPDIPSSPASPGTPGSPSAPAPPKPPLHVERQ